MREKPLISVIVPCHNSSEFLSNCINSLDGQKYPNLQFVIVDDGSEDNTFSILQEKAKKDSRYLVMKNLGQGVSSARNMGIENASGEYLAFLDSDDIIAPNHLTNLYSILEKNGADISICAYKKVKGTSTYRDVKFNNKKPKKTIIYNQKDGLEQLLAQKRFEFSSWNKLYKRKIIMDNNIRFMVGCRYNEDSLFNYKYIKCSKKIVYTKVATHFYVQRKTSLVHQSFKEYRLDAYKSLNTIVKDTYENYAEIKDYSHAIRACIACELLFFIKTSKYDNQKVIAKMIEFLKEDVKHLKYCKRLRLYRRLLIPLVPFIAKLLLRKRLKNLSDEHVLPAFFNCEYPPAVKDDKVAV